MGYLTSAQGWPLRAQRARQMRAQFLREQGFPNLVLARPRRPKVNVRERAAAEEEYQRYAQKRTHEIATNLQALRRR